MTPHLHGERVTMRPLVREDVPRIAEIVHEPEIAKWWGAPTEDALADEFFGDPDVSAFAIEYDGATIGVLEFDEELEPDYKSVSVDITLDTAHVGKGLGADALRTVLRHLFVERGHHRATIDPAAVNERAIAAYRKVGFRPVGVMRQAERTADGTWRDALLMDLLKDELR
jgi:aminoglycoside 6'-N-acetyltransferase